MNRVNLRAAAVAAALLGVCAAGAPAIASPISYNFSMHINASNIPGLKTDGTTDGVFVMTLSDAPTPYYTNVNNLLTYFEAQIDGYSFTAFDACGSHPVGCVSDLQFSAADTLRDLTYFGLADSSTAGNRISLQTSADSFSHFYIQNTGGYADGTFVFLNNDAPAAGAAPGIIPAPEPESIALLLGGLAALGGAIRLRRRRAQAT